MFVRFVHLGLAAAGSATIVAAIAAPAFAATLDITVEGVRSAKGMVRAGVHDAQGRQVARGAAPAVAGRLELKAVVGLPSFDEMRATVEHHAVTAALLSHRRTGGPA